MIPIVPEGWWTSIGLKALTVLTAVCFVLSVDDVLMLTSGNEFEFVSVYLVTPSPLFPSTLSSLPHTHPNVTPLPLHTVTALPLHTLHTQVLPAPPGAHTFRRLPTVSQHYHSRRKCGTGAVCTRCIGRDTLN